MQPKSGILFPRGHPPLTAMQSLHRTLKPNAAGSVVTIFFADAAGPTTLAGVAATAAP